MSVSEVEPSAAAAVAVSGLSQWQRVAYTFFAPLNTIAGITR